MIREIHKRIRETGYVRYVTECIVFGVLFYGMVLGFMLFGDPLV